MKEAGKMDEQKGQESRRRRRHFRDTSIMVQFILIVFLAVLMLLVSFFLTNQVAKNSLKTDYTNMNDSLFEQISANLQSSTDNITNIANSISNNALVAQYIQDGTLSGRSDALSDLRVNLQSFRSIQDQIAQIVICDLDGLPIANVGGIFTDQYFEVSPYRISYYGPVTVDGASYIALTFPVYDNERQSSYPAKTVGTGSLLVSMSLLTSGIGDSLPTEDSWCGIQNPKDDSIIVQTGAFPDGYENTAELADSAEFSLYRTTLSGPGWQLILAVPKQTQYAGLNSLQNINLFSYAVLACCLVLIILLLYFRVLRPVQTEAEFMSWYATHPESKSRMTPSSDNEIGRLAKNLNHMLDEIGRLTEENIRAKEQILITRTELMELDYRKKQTELLAYRNQINPHFLYNTFECIRGMALYYHVGDIATLTEALSRFFRYSVQGSGYAAVSEILDHVRDYAEIIRCRFMNRYRIDIQADPALSQHIFPKMILQPLVENAVFHGCEPSGKDAVVTVLLQPKEISGEEWIHLEVRDQGCGMNAEQLEQLHQKLKEYRKTNLLPNTKHGIGLLNVYRRLLLFYGDNVSFRVFSRENEGTRIVIEVPQKMDVSLEEINENGIFGR